jgi:hypothetical protein
VNTNITVAQLKREISIEESVEVTQLKCLSELEKSDHNDGDSDDDDMAVPTLQDLDDTTLISEYPIQDGIIIVYSM